MNPGGLVIAMLMLVSAAGLLLAPTALAADPYDGTYTGTLSCPAFPDQTPLHVDISITIKDRAAVYATKAGELTGAAERGRGTVSASGELALSGGCDGGFSCVTDYRGSLGAKPIRLKGSQRWYFRAGDRERACTIDLTRAKS
jgi:hypothetical protein